MSYWLAKFFSRICCLLPASFCYWLGEKLGVLSWPFIPAKRRRMAVNNVMDCLGVDAAEAERIAKASWVRFGPMLMEVMRFPVTRDDFNATVKIEGAEYLREGMALGRGAVIATSHCGNWELMGGALCQAGFPIVGVAMKQKEAGMDRFINEFRRAIGMHITYKDDVREMFRLLKQGMIIGLLMDQDCGNRDAIKIAGWFGHAVTNFAHGSATLARYRNSPLFPGYITRHPDGTHTIIIKPPVFVEHTADKDADIRKAMLYVTTALEEHIRTHADEWFWVHDRWKSVRNSQK